MQNLSIIEKDLPVEQKMRGPKIDAKNYGIFRARARSRQLAVGPIDNLKSTRLPTENIQKNNILKIIYLNII